jgi:DNA-directed RNA polymerase subunit H (RpoH/RPB5)
MTEEYYYQIYGFTSRMARARGLEITEGGANSFFLDWEKNNFTGRQRLLNEKEASAEITPDEAAKSREELKKEEKTKYGAGLKYFTETEFPRKFLILTGKSGKFDVIFVIVKNAGGTFVKDTYAKLISEIRKSLKDGTRVVIITYKLPTNLFIKGLNDPTRSFIEHKFLQYDPTLHFRTPKHILMTDEEQKKYLDETQILPGNLIKISRNDVMCRWLGAVPGQIIKIIRLLDYNAIFNIEYQIVTKE